MHSNYSWLQNDEEAQRNILRQDTEKRLEGICAEIVFREQLLETSFEANSSGWWFYLSEGDYYVIKLCVNGINTLTTLDYMILEHFYKNGAKCWVSEFSLLSSCFYISEFSGQDLVTYVRQWDNVRKLNNPKNKKRLSQKPESNQRKEKAIAFIQKKGLLLEVALERLFANLHFKDIGESDDEESDNSKLWDIDYFVLHNDSVLAFEMKQKYPFTMESDDHFGLNLGLIGLFQYLGKKNIHIIHTILTKATWNENLSAVEFLTDREYWEYGVWLAAMFKDEKLSEKVYKASSKTSFSGDRIMYYRTLNVKEFSILGNLSKSEKNSLTKFLNGKCRRVHDVSDIKRKFQWAKQIYPTSTSSNV